MKSIYDTFPDLRIIASGSSALNVYKGSHDLSRRAIIKRMYGFSFREYLEVVTKEGFDIYSLKEILNNHESLAAGIVKKLRVLNGQKVLAHFQDYLKKGYYPYFTQYSDDVEFYLILEQSVHATIETDIPSIYPSVSGVSTRKIKKLLAILAEQVPFKPKLTKLIEVLELTDERRLKLYLKYLADAGLINTVFKEGRGLSVLEKPEKIFLNNTNQIYAFGKDGSNTGSIRETFFVNILSSLQEVNYSNQGDFVVDGSVFEVGGSDKTFNQIRNLPNSYLALDNLESGINKRIPLWLFGFLY